MTKQYSDYYELWKDCYVLAAFLATLGLGLMASEYEMFYEMTKEKPLPFPRSETIPILVSSISGFAIFAIILKEYTE